MSVIKMITAVLLVIGGLNWGLVGLFQFDLVAALFGVGTTLSHIVYTLVGISALFQAVTYLPEEYRRMSSPALRPNKAW